MRIARREFLAASGAVLLTAGRSHSRGSTIPVDLSDNRPFITVQLGSSRHTRDVLCWFDTGGGTFMVVKPVVDALGLPSSGAVVSTEGLHLQPIAPPRLSIGGTEIVLASDAAMMSLDGPTTDPSVSSQAFLPGRFLREHRVLIDYPGKRFGLDQPADTGASALAAQIDARSTFPRLEVVIDGERVGLLLDTGASCTMLSRAYLDKLAAKHPDWKTANGAYGAANMSGGRGELEARMLRIPEIDLSGIVLRDVVAVSRPVGTFEHWMSNMTSAPIIGALGGNALRNLRLQIDYPRNTVTAAHTDNAVPHEFEMVPLTLAPTFKGYQIAGTMAGAKFSVPRESLGGKTLVAIDDETLEGKNIGAVLARLRGEAGNTRRLKIVSQGGVQTVDATVAHII